MEVLSPERILEIREFCDLDELDLVYPEEMNELLDCYELAHPSPNQEKDTSDA